MFSPSVSSPLMLKPGCTSVAEYWSTTPGALSPFGPVRLSELAVTLYSTHQALNLQLHLGKMATPF